MKALVIDDSKVMRRIVGKYLSTVGFEVEEAGNGQEALDFLESHGSVDLACIDWNMPVMSGTMPCISGAFQARIDLVAGSAMKALSPTDSAAMTAT